MKWQFELTDEPINANYPITAKQILSNGISKGPFYLTTADFLAAFQSEPEELQEPEKDSVLDYTTPALPFGTIRYSSNDTRSRQLITLDIPQKDWEIRYGDSDDVFYTVGFPRLVLQYSVTRNSIESEMTIDQTRLYAVENNGKAITEDTRLFTFPYPNVGKGNGIVCWGRNQRLSITDIVELERMFRWFVAAPFNEDHGVRTTLGISNFRKLIETIQDQPFNDEWLMPANKTFGELFIN